MKSATPDFTFEAIRNCFIQEGAKRIIAKPLAENDNSKQQVYLGGSFDVLTLLPFGKVTQDSGVKRENFKAQISFFWLNEAGSFVRAEHAQMILYPDYPEVRLSGFLRGCEAAPSEYMRALPRDQRGMPGMRDGRILFMGVTNDGRILAYLAIKGSVASNEFLIAQQSGQFHENGLFYDIPLEKEDDGLTLLIKALSTVKSKGWIPSVRLDRHGNLIPYKARNGGGYTLEAMLGIIPNARSEPDFHGWEIKAYSGSRITLMTPEPDGGLYGEEGAEAFLRLYGYPRTDDSIYFTGVHRVGESNVKTGHKLILDGYDPIRKRIVDVGGGIVMRDIAGNTSASWSFKGLIEHWGRKHKNAAYINYERFESNLIAYRYLSPALLGTGTDFTRYLAAMHEGLVVYDPAPKLTGASSDRSKVKARSQFRVSINKINFLYESMNSVEY